VQEIAELLRQQELAMPLNDAWSVDPSPAFAWRHVDMGGAWVVIGPPYVYSDYTFVLGFRNSAGQFEPKVQALPPTGPDPVYAKYFISFRHD